MKIHMDIISGFLGAGKTTLINSLISESKVEGERICIFQLEDGKEKIAENSNNNYQIKTKSIRDIKELKQELIFSIAEFNPHRIIIEYNGTWDLNELFLMLNEKIYRETCKVKSVFFVADGKTLNEYIDNIGGFIIPFIQYSDVMIVNNIDEANTKSLEKGLKKLRNINPHGNVLEVNNKFILKSVLKGAKVFESGYLRKIKIQYESSR
ncbi:GTP-binding protein [Clostridium sp. C2-6-12]|uniref:GTP-binding protein n=1 Tax=Clostridium sp. C2-6-12 TaxID=2698832 RepID=UPI00136BFDC8|nr:GTP-binding protein [Clostridium sp. C2-6-12]